VRFTLPILPDASRELAWLMIALSLIAVATSVWWRWCRPT
jgi:NADH:ubiquinone oxidoreductase subunit 4 (subunit M)